MIRHLAGKDSLALMAMITSDFKIKGKPPATLKNIMAHISLHAII